MRVDVSSSRHRAHLPRNGVTRRYPAAASPEASHRASVAGQEELPLLGISLGTGFTFLSSHSLLGLELSTAKDVAPLHSCLFPTFLFSYISLLIFLQPEPLSKEQMPHTHCDLALPPCETVLPFSQRLQVPLKSPIPFLSQNKTNP